MGRNHKALVATMVTDIPAKVRGFTPLQTLIYRHLNSEDIQKAEGTGVFRENDPPIQKWLSNYSKDIKATAGEMWKELAEPIREAKLHTLDESAKKSNLGIPYKTGTDPMEFIPSEEWKDAALPLIDEYLNNLVEFNVPDGLKADLAEMNQFVDDMVFERMVREAPHVDTDQLRNSADKESFTQLRDFAANTKMQLIKLVVLRSINPELTLWKPNESDAQTDNSAAVRKMLVLIGGSVVNANEHHTDRTKWKTQFPTEVCELMERCIVDTRTALEKSFRVRD
ncbi:MAG: hypothetical protein EOO22_00615 [Comamonadaceae bacterium]|nr:MAG: hypothetical protein EOO22_00615 [Comamonadaceae bacterium]